MKNINKKGISLIVLIITIIVIIILAAVVILTLSKNNPIESAKEAAFKEDIRAYQDELNMYISKEYQMLAGQRESKITATGYEKDSSSDEYNNSVYKYLSSFKKKYENKIAIKEDQIAYVGLDDKEKEWLINSGIYMSKKFTISYLDGFGNKLLPDDEKAELDIEYTVYPKEVDGYLPLQSEISGIASQDLSISFKYCKICNDLEFKGLDESGNETQDESQIVSYTVAGIGSCTYPYVAIPEKYNGKDVIKVSDYAFNNNKIIKAVVVPSTIKNVGNQCFASASNLNDAYIDSKIVSDRTFRWDGNIKNIEIGENVEQLIGLVFEGCGSLSNLYINNDKVNLTGDMFLGCNSLESFKIKEDNKKYSVKDGVLFNKDKTKLICYPNGKKGDTYVITDNIKELADYAFRYAKFLKNINVPNTVNKIGYEVFSNSSLTDVTLDCKIIADRAFRYDSGLKNVEIGEDVEQIVGLTFEGCGSLSNLYINNDKVNITGRKFLNCTSLKEIKFNEGNNSNICENGVVYNKDKTEIKVYLQGNTAEEFTISNNITSIGEYAFWCVRNLKTINYTGTKSQWNNIIKGSYWNYSSSLKTIHCTDGDISL